MSKINFTTQVEEKIKSTFAKKVQKKGLKIGHVIENLMDAYNKEKE